MKQSNKPGSPRALTLAEVNRVSGGDSQCVAVVTCTEVRPNVTYCSTTVTCTEVKK